MVGVSLPNTLHGGSWGLPPKLGSRYVNEFRYGAPWGGNGTAWSGPRLSSLLVFWFLSSAAKMVRFRSFHSRVDCSCPSLAILKPLLTINILRVVSHYWAWYNRYEPASCSWWGDDFVGKGGLPGVCWAASLLQARWQLLVSRSFLRDSWCLDYIRDVCSWKYSLVLKVWSYIISWILLALTSAFNRNQLSAVNFDLAADFDLRTKDQVSRSVQRLIHILNLVKIYQDHYIGCEWTMT